MHLCLLTLSGTEEAFVINTDTDIKCQQLETSVVFEMHCRKTGMFEAKRGLVWSCQHMDDQYADK